MNILLTSVGRRNYMINYLREAELGSHSTSVQIVGVDADPAAPGLAEADFSCVVPAVFDERYPSALLELCERHSIGMLIPLSDLDVARLAPLRQDFERIGVIAFLPDLRVSGLCADKLLTSRLLDRVGIASPRTVAVSSAGLASNEVLDLQFPVIVKPRFGSASIGVIECIDPTRIKAAVRSVESSIQKSPLGELSTEELSVIVQEILPGEEYGLDIGNDHRGNFRGVAVRKKLSLRAGETDRAETVSPEPFLEIARILSRELRHRGNLDVDAFLYEGNVSVLELNARFGGGYPFSHEGGFDLAPSLVKWIESDLAHQLGAASVGKRFSKCDRLVDCTGEPAQAERGNQIH